MFSWTPQCAMGEASTIRTPCSGDASLECWIIGATLSSPTAGRRTSVTQQRVSRIVVRLSWYVTAAHPFWHTSGLGQVEMKGRQNLDSALGAGFGGGRGGGGEGGRGIGGTCDEHRSLNARRCTASSVPPCFRQWSATCPSSASPSPCAAGGDDRRRCSCGDSASPSPPNSCSPAGAADPRHSLLIVAAGRFVGP